jgi:hypothetical protein
MIKTISIHKIQMKYNRNYIMVILHDIMRITIVKIFSDYTADYTLRSNNDQIFLDEMEQFCTTDSVSDVFFRGPCDLILLPM